MFLVWKCRYNIYLCIEQTNQQEKGCRTICQTLHISNRKYKAVFLFLQVQRKQKT